MTAAFFVKYNFLAFCKIIRESSNASLCCYGSNQNDELHGFALNEKELKKSLLFRHLVRRDSRGKLAENREVERQGTESPKRKTPINPCFLGLSGSRLSTRF